MAITGLKRVLSLADVSFIAIGFTIGGGVFVFTGIVLKIVGPALPLAYALAALPVFISMLPLAMLGSALPSTGGNYKYPSRMISPGLAFVGVWTYALASFFGQLPLYALACANYVKVFAPHLSVSCFAVGLITLFFLVNILGIRLAAQVQGIMVVILISALLLYSGKGLFVLDQTNFTGFFQNGAGNIALGIALLTFTYLGSNGIIELGGEIKEPGRVIPRAIFIAFPITTLLYTLLAIATVGVFPCQKLLNEPEPLITVCKQYFAKQCIIFFVAGGAILALTTTLNAIFIVGTKSLLVIIDDGIFPKWLGKLNTRFGTPHFLLLIIWALSILGVLSGFSLETFASYAALGGIIIFFPVFLAALILPRRYPEKYKNSQFKLKGPWIWICPCIGFAIGIFFSIIILVDLKSLTKISFFMVFIASGIVYYLIRKSLLLKQGIDLGNIKNQEDWIDD